MAGARTPHLEECAGVATHLICEGPRLGLGTIALNMPGKTKRKFFLALRQARLSGEHRGHSV